MRPHYDNLIRACVANGIGYLNPRFTPDGPKDADGVPLEAEMLFFPGQEYRIVSFDEMKCDDKTHGDGGDRKAKGERTVRCGPEDTGECVGAKHTSHPASVVGGTIGTGEALPCFGCTASSTIDPAWFEVGPTTTINGVVIKMDGTCNPKGSINNEAAVEYIRRSVLRAFKARELPTAEKKGIVVCDGVGSHLSPEFCDFLIANHLVLILRTPNCSQKQQPEDLVSFQRVKNAAPPIGFYVRKQEAVIEQLARTCSAGLPYDVLFGRCLKPAWENGFQAAYNREAWQKAGLNERGGITARPYWVQLRVENPQRKRKAVAPGAKQRALDAAALTRRAEWDALKPAWQQGNSTQQALALTMDSGEGAEEEGESGGGGRLTSGELSQLSCAATDAPAQKFLQYKLDISRVKGMKAAELKAELANLSGKPVYTNAPAAKVELIRALEHTYATAPTLLEDGTAVSIDWRVRASWLPAELKAIMYPQQEQQQLTVVAPAKKQRALGEGAYLCSPSPAAGPLLLQQVPVATVTATVTATAHAATTFVPIVHVETGMDMAQAPA